LPYFFSIEGKYDAGPVTFFSAMLKMVVDSLAGCHDPSDKRFTHQLKV